jgi:acyl carrier protein phosphodiesterase
MGWGFRKSMKAGPGIRIGVGKGGVGTSVGARGFMVNTRGRLTASVPGAGIRLAHNLKRRAELTAHLSKREQAAREFAQQVRSRMCTALVDYFFSHGVHVHDDDLDEALALADHQAFLESLSAEFDATTGAIQLATDLGSISLAEKERAMRALYEIERQCAERQGGRAGLKEAAAALQDAVRSWPSRPGLVIPLLVALCGACVAGTSNAGAGVVLTGLMLTYGWFRVRTYRRNCAASLAAIDAANQRFDSVLAVEVTPRPARPSSKDFVVPKAAGCAAVAVVALLAAVGVHFPDPAGHANGAPSENPVVRQVQSLDMPVARTPQTAARPFAPSFNCRKARSDAEHLVCGDAGLAAADVELASIHAKAKAAALDRRAFRKRSAAQWLYRERTCHDRACVARWYADQKAALTEIARTGLIGEDVHQPSD